MKWAILSDVHGNLEAFKAVIADLKAEGAERVAFLGDIVGYGADPDECLLLLRDLAEIIIAGNHDYGAAGLTDLSFFNPMAKAAVLWTGKRIDEESRIFLRRLPLVKILGNITFVHATPNDPGEWNYIFTFAEAEEGFQSLKGDLAFIGHSHHPMILRKRGNEQVELVEEEETTLQEGSRYIINTGSVGQPRDRNPRAAYGLFDDSSKKYLLKRVPYDVPTAQKKIIKAGLPPYLAYRLAQGV